MNNLSRILIVEDTESHQKIYHRYVESLGYEHEIAGTAEKAKELLSQTFFHVVILDLSLDQNDSEDRQGFQVLDTIYKLDEGTQVIIQSAFGGLSDANVAFKKYGNHVSGFIEKTKLSKESFEEEINRAVTRVDQLLLMPNIRERILRRRNSQDILAVTNNRILVIENESSWQSLYTKILTKQGFSVDVAGNLKDALDTLKAKEYELAIVDVRLEEADPEDESGLELLSQIRTLSPQTSIIVVTAYEFDDEKVRNAFVKYGAIDFIKKREFDPNKFLLKISDSLQQNVFFGFQLIDEGEILRLSKKYRLVLSCHNNRPKAQNIIRLPVRKDSSLSLKFSITLISSEEIKIFPAYQQEIDLLPDEEEKKIEFELLPQSPGNFRIGVNIEHSLRLLVTNWLNIAVE